MATPTVTALRRAFPAAWIAALARAPLMGLLEDNPHLSEVLSGDAAGAHLPFPHLLKKKGFDLILLLPNSFRSALLAFLCGPPYRVGYATDHRRLLLTNFLETDGHSRPVHQVESYLNLLRVLDIQPEEGELLVPVGPQARAFAEAVWAAQGIGPQQLVIGLSPAAAFGPSKCWPAEYYARLADRLVTELGAAVFFFGHRTERRQVEGIVGRMQQPAVSMAGKDDLQKLAAMLQRCHLLISGDTGPMHLARAVGTPVVALFGPTDPRLTAPYGGESVVIRREVPCSPCFKQVCPIQHPCMTGITVEEVFNGVEQILARRVHEQHIPFSAAGGYREYQRL